jgi:hypothetical protein
MKSNLFSVYKTTDDDKSRFYLGEEGSKVLVFCGLNPSTATKEKSDTTISKVKQYAKNYGYDSFLMINLYPLRSTDPGKLPIELDEKLHLENIRNIKRILKYYKQSDLLVCWGNNIKDRKYLRKCFANIWSETKEFFRGVYRIGDLTKTGEPRHPSRAAYPLVKTKFDIKNYLDE